ncbi:c-type cytochrome [Pseudomonas sp. GD03860]|uniref:c-type cytochrome n=1 Tax=Pseudomonas TaxID=286 RepID=UPI002364935E|nr:MULTISPECIES: c-type cytochrome [Pseudomonas]MDD2056830.1 c-type cytochrome [Pseudomonas putida]MDH0637970.1 c-type cytochrome [Pseudomonas sp. GD03860]
MIHTYLITASALLLAAPLCLAQGDAAQGKALFTTQCGYCHSVEAGKHMMGPSLLGVAGKASAQAPGFNYSPVFKAAGLTWDDASLDRWLTNPAAMVAGNMMMFPGQADAKAREHLIAYLKQLK